MWLAEHLRGPRCYARRRLMQQGMSLELASREPFGAARGRIRTIPCEVRHNVAPRSRERNQPWYLSTAAKPVATEVRAYGERTAAEWRQQKSDFQHAEAARASCHAADVQMVE